MLNDMKEPKIIVECKLDDGRILPYDTCHDDKSLEDGWTGYKLQYLGEGIFYSYDGVIQPQSDPPKKMHFWVYQK